MAILWSREVVDGDRIDRYEVRSAGRSRRLYTNGVFHSQFNPVRPVAGSVWDLLLLPAFFHPPTGVRRVLVLGVGGGAVLRQLQHFIAPELVLGVELNAVHLQVAQRFFGVSGPPFQLLQADAIDWLQHYRGPAFDLIIDDLFGDRDGQPCRAVAADREWCQWLQSHLSADGSVVMNFDSLTLLRGCGFLTAESLRDSWRRAWWLSTPLYENAVGVFTRQDTSRAQFRQALQQHPQLDERRSTCYLNYRLQKLAG